jgi:hypothetical protein
MICNFIFKFCFKPFFRSCNLYWTETRIPTCTGQYFSWTEIRAILFTTESGFQSSEVHELDLFHIWCWSIVLNLWLYCLFGFLRMCRIYFACAYIVYLLFCLVHSLFCPQFRRYKITCQNASWRDWFIPLWCTYWQCSVCVSFFVWKTYREAATLQGSFVLWHSSLQK